MTTSIYPKYVIDDGIIKKASFTNLNFENIQSIEENALLKLFFENDQINGSISFPNLTNIGKRGLYYAFSNCNKITSISFPNLVSIGYDGMNGIFSNCGEILGSVTFPKLATLGNWALSLAFKSCNKITSFYFPKLKNVEDYSLYNTFMYCENLQEIHFRADSESTIRNTNLNLDDEDILYFDLGFIHLNIIPNVPNCNYYFEGRQVSNSIDMMSSITNTYYVYCDGYCLYEGTKVFSENDEEKTINDNITLSSSGYVSTLNITIPTHSSNNTTDLVTKYTYNGTLIKTDTKSNISTNTTQVSTSIKVPSNTQISYEINASGFKRVQGTVTPTNNTVNISLEEVVFKSVQLSYPFTNNSEYLTNLVDNNNFIIFDDTETPPSCIVSGPSSYHQVSSGGGSVGYIRFRTPDTDNVQLLTVTVVCTSYAESSYDYGVVFINTTGRMPYYDEDGTEELETPAGSEDPSYGYILFQGQNNQSSEFRTVSKVLEPDTIYYLGFYYRKDGSDSENWDRLAIRSISFTDSESASITTYNIHESYNDLNGSSIDDPTLSYEGWIKYKRISGNTTLQSLNGTFTTSNNITLNNITETTYSSGNDEFIQVNFWISLVNQENGNYSFTIDYTPGQHSGVTFSNGVIQMIGYYTISLP